MLEKSLRIFAAPSPCSLANRAAVAVDRHHGGAVRGVRGKRDRAAAPPPRGAAAVARGLPDLQSDDGQAQRAAEPPSAAGRRCGHRRLRRGGRFPGQDTIE